MHHLHILVVEGNPHLRSLLAWQLQQLGHRVKTSESLSTAKALIQEHIIHLLILDMDLADQACLQFCHWVDRHSNPLMLLLSSYSSESNEIAALEAGADDYLTKPLSVQVLSARVKALCRRLYRAVPPTYLEYGELRIDLVQRRVTVAQEAIDLTPQEFSLLFVLVQASGSPLSRAELLQKAWSGSIDNPRTVDTHILSLRKKIEADPRQPSLIQTIRNVGYCFCHDQSTALADSLAENRSRPHPNGRSSTPKPLPKPSLNGKV